MADSVCTVAVRTAHMLGLHLEPPTSMSVCEGKGVATSTLVVAVRSRQQDRDEARASFSGVSIECGAFTGE